MIAHTTLHVSHYVKAKAFYTKVLKTLGYKQSMEFGEAAGFNDGENTDFWIGAEKSVVPTHLAFQAKDRKQVETFYETAVSAGGKDNGKPGYRDYSPGYFAAFVIDPDLPAAAAFTFALTLTLPKRSPLRAFPVARGRAP